MSDRRRHQLIGAVVLVGLTATACSGPAAPLDIGTQTVPIALVLGELQAVQEAPLGPISAPVQPQDLPYFSQPAAGQPPDPLPPLSPPAEELLPMPTGPCPDVDPLAPVLAVGHTIEAPPVKATYRYRALVTDTYPGKASAYAGDSIWTIEPGPVDAVTGSYDVTYTVKMGAATTKRVLRTLPRDLAAADPSAPPNDPNPNDAIVIANANLASQGVPPIPSTAPNPAGYGLAGVYLVSQESNGVVFRPSTPIALLQLRQVTGAENAEAAAAAGAITSAGSDPVTGAVMAFRSTVTSATNKVNACGTPLQTVQVALTSPNSPATTPPPNPATHLVPTDGAVYAERAPSTDPTNPKSNVLLFAEKIDFGLQYGGLVVQDALTVGSLNGVQVSADKPPAPPKEITLGGVLGSFLSWYANHAILKQSAFTINEQPQYRKAASTS